MSHRLGRFSLLVPIVACAAVIGPVSVAQASDASLRSTVEAGIPKITRSQAKILDGEAAFEQTHSAAALVKAVKAQDKTLKTLDTKVKGQSPSTPVGTKAKSDIVKGLRLIVASNTSLVSDYKLAQQGHPVTRAQLNVMVNEANTGNVDMLTGIKLLEQEPVQIPQS
jgi:hypothetical protein